MNLTPEIRNPKIPVEEEEGGGEAEGPSSSAKARREKALERFSIHFVSVKLTDWGGRGTNLNLKEYPLC